MSIYRCPACGFIGEEPAAPGAKLPCAKCGVTSTLFATVFYVQKLAERYLAARRELTALRQAVADPEGESSCAQDQPGASVPLSADELHDTDQLATEAQHRPLRDWLGARQIGATFVLDAVDTTGYFDEAARDMGGQYALLAGVIGQVRYAYGQQFSWVKVDLARHEPAARQRILDFCRQLYSHTLFARYSFRKQSLELGLGIQPAQVVREFFLGGWLEWYALGVLLQLCAQKRLEFSCARNATLALPNAELRELDVVVLAGARKLVVVECKTGEFRADIGKYAKLRQRLGLDRTQFVICHPDLPDDQLAALGSMYELTFVNLASLRGHLQSLF